MIDLLPIYEYANEVLSAPECKATVGGLGAINWGDLGCTDVQECRSVHDNYATVTVTIEEASPDGNNELREYMYEKLMTKFPGIAFEINTEW